MVQHAYIIKIAKILLSPFASNTTLVTLLSVDSVIIVHQVIVIRSANLCNNCCNCGVHNLCMNCGSTQI
jgi:hypothetical protein